MAVEVHGQREATGKSSWRFEMQKRLGASPKGQGRTLRPHDSRKAPDQIFDQKASESVKGSPLAMRSHWEIGLAVQDATGPRRLSKGSWSHTATTRKLEALDSILDHEATESIFGGTMESPRHAESVPEGQEARWSRRITKGSVSHIATIRQLEGAGRH